MWAMNVLHLSHRPCTTWSWSLRWRRWRSSKSAWSTGAPWRQSCTASPPSPAAPPRSSWAPSPCRKCLPADSSTTLSCPRWVTRICHLTQPLASFSTLSPSCSATLSTSGWATKVCRPRLHTPCLSSYSRHHAPAGDACPLIRSYPRWVWKNCKDLSHFAAGILLSGELGHQYFSSNDPYSQFWVSVL